MFDYRGNLSGRQKAASMLIGMPIAMGAGWLFGKFVERKAEEMADDQRVKSTIAHCQEQLDVLGIDIETDPSEHARKAELIEKGKFAVSLVGGALIGKAVGETSKAAVYHSTN
jgi:hypothetical protein